MLLLFYLNLASPKAKACLKSLIYVQEGRALTPAAWPTANRLTATWVGKAAASLAARVSTPGRGGRSQRGQPATTLLPSLQSGKQPRIYSHCNENPIYVFLFWELRGLSPNFQINVSVSDLYKFPGSVYIFSCSRIGRPIMGIYKSLTDTWMWKLGLRPHISFSGKYLFLILGIVSLQCI